MIDFTSALYLGMEHASHQLSAWSRLSESRPAALLERAVDEATARALAELQGCQAAVLSTSTLHLFWDLGGLLAGAPLLVDAGAYAIGQWGAERAAARGSHVTRFAHHEPAALARRLASVPAGPGPVVLCDGFCPGCGRAAPLPEYLALVKGRGGWLLIDDTQSLGIWGSEPREGRHFGDGGGGSVRRWALPEDDGIVLVSSLAKGFGVPLAVLSGSRRRIEAFRRQSETRERCSPPSAASVHAAAAALGTNREHGEELRERLYERVRCFRGAVAAVGVRVRGNLFPVQSLAPGGGAESIHRSLLSRGIRTVLHRPTAASSGQISFIITARHSIGQLQTAARGTVAALREVRRERATAPSSRRKVEKPCGRLVTERT